MFKRLFHILITLVLTCLSASAQFYVTGDDPGKLKWSYIESDHFRIIYPTGSDSLAKAYGIDLEKYRIPLSRTSGYLGSGGFGKKMPVVLHTHNGANGSVAWAPKEWTCSHFQRPTTLSRFLGAECYQFMKDDTSHKCNLA